MAFQVSLTTSTSPTSYSVSPVNVEGLADLRQELEKRGAKRWARYWRDALNDSHVEGGFRMLDELSQSDFEWLLEKRP